MPGAAVGGGALAIVTRDYQSINPRTPCSSGSPPQLILQIINKTFDYNRSKILKEIDIFHHCRGHSNILQLNEYYEESEKFYLVFDRLKGGDLERLCSQRR